MLKWIGDKRGSCGIVGIPARDLTNDEVKQFGEEYLLSTGLYEKAKAKRAALPKPAAKEKAED